MQNHLTHIIINTDKRFPQNQDIFKTPGKIYTFLNPVSYLDASKKPQLFEAFDGIFSDGSLLVKAIKSLYGYSVQRRSFDMTSLAPELMEFAVQNQKTIYIVASKEEEVQKATHIFKEQYPRLQFCGIRHGYFKSEEEKEEVMKQIIQSHPDFLIVGMGAGKQEDFLLKIKQMGFQGIGFTCGGFIHQTAKNNISYYPQWVDKYNLRFVYRMYREKHTRKRYLKAGLVFPWVFLKDRF